MSVFQFIYSLFAWMPFPINIICIGLTAIFLVLTIFAIIKLFLSILFVWK